MAAHHSEHSACHMELLISTLRLANGRSCRSNLRPQLGALLGNRASDRRALHLALVVDNDTGVVLKVHKDAINAPPGLLLPNHNSFQHLLAQLWLTFLHSGENHIAWC